MHPSIDQILNDLPLCMIADRRRLSSRARDLARTNRLDGPDFTRLVQELERSRSRAELRRANLPKPVFPAELPVSERKDEIAAAIQKNQVVVLCGETGSGKTTQLPKICLSLGRGVTGLIGHTQPRRIAARSVATRIAEELGSRLGNPGSPVGYKVRFGDQTHPDNYIKLMTDGILLAETQGDPNLEQYDTIIIDEAHERGLNIDFLLGYLRQLLPRRPDLKIIVTSATIDPDRFAKHFTLPGAPPVPVFEVSGRVFPVETRYRPLELPPGWEEELDEDEPDLQEAILRAVDELAAPGMAGGDILIFLSGEREIRETAENLRKHHPAGTLILPLYARLSSDEQQRVFQVRPGSRRIVLATNVAETSLTVPGIRYVIDPGFARISRYSARTKVQRLPIEKISQASADQRKGRCGRLSDGICIRLYSKQDFDDRPRFTDPEILRTNLASVILQMAALRLGRVDRFPFIEPPDPRMVKDGYETLLELGAIDENPDEGGAAQLTEIGRRIARFPVDPRIARIILAGEKENALDDVLIIAAALSVQDPRERPIELADKADMAHATFRDEHSDFVAILKLWKAYHDEAKHKSSSKLRKWCKDSFISYVRMREWHDIHSQLKELASELGLRGKGSAKPTITKAASAQPPRGAPQRLNLPPVDAAKSQVADMNAPLHRALLSGLLSSVGTLPEATSKTVNRFEYHGPRGLRFNIFPGSGLFKKNPKWVVAAEVVKTTKQYARTVGAVKPEWIEYAGAHLLKKHHADPWWDERRAQVWANERITLFGLELVPKRAIHFGPINPKLSRELFIHHALVESQYWSNQPFARHNKALIEEVEALQHKLRRRDFILDIQARFEFFDKKLPPDVYSGQTFENWSREAQRANPRILFMTLAELLQPGWGISPDTLKTLYPDQLEIGGTPFQLEYLFDPGSTADGVTLVVPVPALGLITETRADWIIPGLLEEKIIELMRSLPKDLRRSMVPIPDYAKRAITTMTDQDTPLTVTLANTLARLTGETINPAQFQTHLLPPHLRLNIRVIEPPDKILAEGRDLSAIQSELRGVVRASLAGSTSSTWNRDGLTDWDFDRLPDEAEVSRAGLRFIAYPALVDLRDPGVANRPKAAADAAKVGLRLFDTSEKAKKATERGLRRLLHLRAKEEIRWNLAHVASPSMQQLLVSYGPVGQPKDLQEEMGDLVAQIAFLSDRNERVVTREEFESVLNSGWDGINAAAAKAASLVGGVLGQRQSLALRFPELMLAPTDPFKGPPAWAPAVSDMRLQLRELMPSGFVVSTPLEWMQQMPRYLQAIDRRVQKLTAAGQQGAARDAKLADEIKPLWVAYLDRARKHRSEGREEPALVEFRWHLEELRVSLYAQELGTLVPVSVKRLEKKWGDVPV